mgnify:CR=1 FL=1
MRTIIAVPRCYNEAIGSPTCPWFTPATWDTANRKWATMPLCRKYQKPVVEGQRIEACRFGEIVIEMEMRDEG